MLILSLLLALTPRAVHLESKPEVFQLTIVDQHGIRAVSEGKLFHWNLAGLLLATIETDGRIAAHHYFHGFYLLSYLEEGEPVTRIFSPAGEPLSDTLPFMRHIYEVDDQLFSPLSLTTRETRRHRWPFLAEQFELIKDPTGWNIHPTGIRFAKFKEIDIAHAYNYKRLWLVQHKGNVILGVHQLEPRIYYYSPDARELERKQGATRATQITYTALTLPHFVAAPANHFRVERVMPASQARYAYRQWYLGFSRMSFFGRLGSGYLVGYTVPRRNEQGELDGDEQLVILLDKNFHPSGEAFSLPSPVAGTVGNAFYYADQSDLFSSEEW